MRAHRRRLGLSQEDLAALAGLGVRTLRNIELNEGGTPRPVTVRLLADALGLSGPDRDWFCQAGLIATPHQVARSGRPAQLPPDVHGFAGRVAELAALDAVATSGGGRPAAVVITAMSGTAGVGKTALAVHWAHRMADRFPDGQLYVNLRGFDPAVTVLDPAEALRRFLDALGVPVQRIPADPHARADLYRSLLSDRRMLIVLDNARDPDQVRPLLPAAPGCLVLVTSRNRLTGLVAAEAAHPLSLDLLSPDEARELLCRRLGADRVDAEPDTVDAIIARCARLPLALAIFAAHAATQPGRSLTTLADQLQDSHERLDILSTGDTAITDIRAVFSWSYRALTPPAARLFRLLGLHPGPHLATPAAAALTGLPVDRVRRLLAELVRAHLIAEDSAGRYTAHDLLRTYAAELASAEGCAADRDPALLRMFDHYLRTAHAAALLLDSYRDPIVLADPVQGSATLDHATAADAMTWCITERTVLLSVLECAADSGFDVHAWQLAWTLEVFFERRGHWDDWMATQQVALCAARRLGEGLVEARCHRDLGHAYERLGRFDEASAHLIHSLDLYRALDDPPGQAHSHRGLARVLWRQERPVEALQHAHEARKLYEETDHRAGQADALNNIGWLQSHLGNHVEALESCRRARDLQHEVGDRHGEANAWDSLGHIHHQLRQYPEATECYRQALDLFVKEGDRTLEADTLTGLAELHLDTGDVPAARGAWQDALRILDELGHPEADRVRAKLRSLDDERPRQHV